MIIGNTTVSSPGTAADEFILNLFFLTLFYDYYSTIKHIVFKHIILVCVMRCHMSLTCKVIEKLDSAMTQLEILTNQKNL